MRKLSFLLVILLSLSLLFSCGSPNNSGGTQDGAGEGGTEDGGSTASENFVYSGDSELYLVRTSPYVTARTVTLINNALLASRGTKPHLRTDETEKCPHELVIGETNRAISRKAYQKLKILTRVDEDLGGYVIYSDGKSIAVAFTSDTDSYALNQAIDKLVTAYLSADTLAPAKGIVEQFTYSKKELAEAQDAEYLADRWSNVQITLTQKCGDKELAERIVASLKSLYELYTDDMITWLANLYDPVTGGFYYSNSARDTLGYLPDIESTLQALAFIDASGMSETSGGKYELVLPESIKGAIGNFIRGLQDPKDGYFYHPQWGKGISLSRQGRDLGSATTLLRRLGFTPLYKLPTDTSSASASAYVTGRIRDTGAAYAVSKVTPAASLETAPERFKSEANWRAYLASLDLRTNSYSIGNQLQSSVSQIRAYSTLLGVDLMEITMDWLDENQNPETGLWHYEVSYTASNSLHKIFSVYNSAGRPIPNVDKAISAAIASITSEEPLSAGVDIYNAWSVLPYAFTNIRKYNPDAADVIKTVLADLYKNAPDMIDVSHKKIAPLKKEDGSFSYGAIYSASTSQGAPAAVPGSIEGDVNGNGIACTALVTQIFNALEFDVIVPIFTKTDLDTYIEIIENCIPIEKAGETESLKYDFDEDEVGSSPVDMGVVDSTLGGSGVVADPRPSAKGNVYKHVHQPTLADTLTVYNSMDSFSKSMHGFEGDFCIVSASDGYNMQITLGSAFLFTFRVKNGNISIVVSSTTSAATSVDVDLGVSIPVGEWFNVRIEHYLGDHNTVRTVIYLNGKAIAVTDNYYGKPREGTGNPATLYTGAVIHFMKSCTMTMMFDNLHAYCENKLYSPMKLENDSYVNVDKDKAEAQTPV